MTAPVTYSIQVYEHERDLIVAALRLWQSTPPWVREMPRYRDLASGLNSHGVPLDAQIDRLCIEIVSTDPDLED